MNDRAISALADPRPDLQAEAAETVGGVITDLVELTREMPVPTGQVEASARILDRLAEEITEAAAMLWAAHGQAGEPGQ